MNRSDSFHFNDPFPVPQFGETIAVADRIHWLRLPFSGVLNHVNVYLIEDGEEFTLVDTGSNSDVNREIFAKLTIDGSAVLPKIRRVVVTHYHSDHIGLAGFFAQNGAALWMTRTCALQAKVLLAENHLLPSKEQLDFMIRGGLGGLALSSYSRLPMPLYSEFVEELPYSYHRIKAGDSIPIDMKTWDVQTGDGHAAEQASLWQETKYAILGDQVLSGISSNLSVLASEPYEDLVSEWVVSCRRWTREDLNQTVCLPGHGIPFIGLSNRCQQMLDGVERLLNRILDSLSKPHTAYQLLDPIYRRPLRDHEQRVALSEMIGFLNHLNRKGFIRLMDYGSNRIVDRWIRCHGLPYHF